MMMNHLSDIDTTKSVCFFAPKSDVKLTNSYLCPEYHNIFKALSKLTRELDNQGFHDFITDGNFGFAPFMGCITDCNSRYHHHMVLNTRKNLPSSLFGTICRATSVTDISERYKHEKHTAYTKYQKEANEAMLQNSAVTVVMWKHHLDYNKYKTTIANMIRQSLEMNHPVILLDPKTGECKTIQP